MQISPFIQIKHFSLIAFTSTAISMNSCQSVKTSAALVENEAQPHLISKGYAFTEGPAADPSGNVYFTDQPNDKIYKWNWQTNQISLFSSNTGRANGTFFDKDGHLISCSDNRGELWKFSRDGKNHEVLNTGYLGKRLNGPNDLWIDADGGIYFTDPLYERDYWTDFKQEIPEKKLYYRATDGTVRAIDAFTQPNGIIGSNQLKKLYVSDIDAAKTYVYNILGDGKLSDKKLFCNMGSDGMTLDSKGNLYLTGDGVTVFNPEGQKIFHIPVPEKWTSNVTFGGKNFSTLFITASESVYALKMNVSRIR